MAGAVRVSNANYSPRHMQTSRLTVLLLVGSAAMQPALAADEVTTLMDGHKLRSFMNAPVKSANRQVGLGYVLGVRDSYSSAKVCIDSKVQVEQLFEVVKKYLDETPQSLHKPGDQIVRDALYKAFPCPN